jgi:hypothetical protein
MGQSSLFFAKKNSTWEPPHVINVKSIKVINTFDGYFIYNDPFYMNLTPLELFKSLSMLKLFTLYKRILANKYVFINL